MVDQPFKGNAFTRGADRASLYSEKWQDPSLKDAIEQFVPGAEKSEIGGKTIFSDSQSDFQVVYDRGGNYFRIQKMDVKGKRSYTGLDGNIPNNKTVNGKTTGNNQAEYNGLTHFNNIDIKQ